MLKVGLIAGRSNPGLAHKISEQLGIPLIDCKIQDFPNGEIYVEIKENVRGKIIYFVQTGSKSADRKLSLNDGYVEAIEVADACRRSGVKSISIIYATFPYARSDKKDKPRVSIMSSVIANGLEEAGYSRIICMDIHAGQTQGVTTIPFDNLYAINLHIQNLKETLFQELTSEEINDEFVLVAPDMGSIRRIKAYASKLRMPHAVMDKQRDYSKPGTVEHSTLVGDVKGKTAIVIDDMADTMGTMIAAVNELVSHGVINVIVIVTHGILSGPAISRINECHAISRMIVTNTIDQTRNIELCSKLQVVDTSGLFANVIRCLATDASIAALFE